MSLKTNYQLEKFHDVYELRSSFTFIQLLTGSILEIVARGLMTDFMVQQQDATINLLHYLQ